MRILYTSDIHANPGHLESMARAVWVHDVDTLIVGGDLVPHYLPRKPGMSILEAQAVYLELTLVPALKRLKAQTEITIYLDLGNDDFAANRRILEDHSGDLIHLLHMQKHALTDQVDLVGYMTVPPTPFTRKDWEKPDSRARPYSPGSRVRLDGHITSGGSMAEVTLDINTDETIAADLEQLSARIDGPFVFVAHCPPYGTPLDVLFSGEHAGSLSIRHFIERWSRAGRLIAALHGHIHESPRMSGTNQMRINKTVCINPGQGDALQYVILELSPDKGSIWIRQLAS